VRVQTIVRGIRNVMAAAIIFISVSPAAEAQDALQDSIQSLLKQTTELRAMVEDMRAETTALRRELEATRQQLSAAVPQAREAVSLQNLEEEQQLLSAKVEEQYQTKVESSSKYRVKLSGLVHVNLFGNSGVVDNLDFPSLALEDRRVYRRGSFGGSLRQSLIGFEVFGPAIKGAHTGADVSFDFAGGFPNTPDGVTFGLPRLRTGVVRMSWPSTTLTAGQDAPFFSPLSPSSPASLAIPALA